MKETSPQQPTATVSSVLLRASREEASRKTVAGKKVKFSTPPKWRARHTVSGLKQKRGRPALRTLQPAASNPRHLVGAGSPRSHTIGKPKKMGRLPDTKEKRAVVALPQQRPEVGSVTVSEKAVQTTDATITETGAEPSIDYKMITEAVPPVEYWQVLAEQRRLALAETLHENEELHGEVERLKLKVAELETQVQNVDYFAMMYSLATDNTEDSALAS